MIPVHGPLKAHRKFNQNPVSPPPGSSYYPYWDPIEGPELSTIRIATMPSFADAVARQIVSSATSNPIDSPELVQFGDAGGTVPSVLHLTYHGNAVDTGYPVPYPRCVYILGTPFESTGLDPLEFPLALAEAYAPLAEIGVRLIYGSFVGQLVLQRPHLAMAPINGFTTDDFFQVFPTVEAAEYDGGDLYVAHIQSEQGLGFYNSIGFASGYACATTDGSAPPGYTDVETSGISRLMIGTPQVNSDVALAVDHIERYRRCGLHFYHPPGGVQFGSSPTVTFSTTYAQLLGMVNPAGHPSSEYTVGDVTALAEQIVADALAFFA